jgi:hypothetical protein
MIPTCGSVASQINLPFTSKHLDMRSPGEDEDTYDFQYGDPRAFDNHAELFMDADPAVCRVTGSVRACGSVFQIVPSTPNNHTLRRVDFSLLPHHHEDTVLRAPQEPTKRETSTHQLQNDFAERRLSQTTIRVTVAYTAKAAAQIPDMTAMINSAIVQTNTGFQSSGLPISVELAYVYQSDIVEDGIMLTSLHAFEDTDKHGAALAILYTTDTNGCGLANYNPCLVSGSCTGSAQSNSYGVVSVSWNNDCHEKFTFGHEMGHILGLGHDTANVHAGVHGQAQGFVIQSGHFHTIMSYSSGGSNAVNYWSNPDALYQGLPLGDSSANTAGVLRTTAPVVASWASSGGGGTSTSCRYANDGVCDVPQYCDAGTDGNDCDETPDPIVCCYAPGWDYFWSCTASCNGQLQTRSSCPTSVCNECGGITCSSAGTLICKHMCFTHFALNQVRARRQAHRATTHRQAHLPPQARASPATCT